MDDSSFGCVVVAWLIIGAVVGGLIGSHRNNTGLGISLGLLLGPIGWLIAALSTGDLRKCPFCAEFVKPEAKVCKHCGRDLPSETAHSIAVAAPTPAPPAPPPEPMSRRAKLAGALGVLLAIVLIAVAVWQGSKDARESADAPAPTDANHFHLTSDYDVYEKGTFRPIHLRKGTVLEYVETNGSVITFRYNGRVYAVPSVFTDR